MATAASKYKSKKFRIGLEGATTDGRRIKKEWIEQMARNYDAKKYGARINIEHITGMHPESMFRAMGDVVSLETEKFNDNGVEKLALVAEIAPTEELVQYAQKRQKIYTSMELNTSFADTGECYLTGLAITDTPASLGTEMLQFAAQATHNPLASRKTHPDNLFTEALETPLGFEPESDESESLTAKIKAMFTKTKTDNEAAMDKFQKDTESALSVLAEQIKGFTAQIDTLKAELAKFSQAPETPAQPEAPSAEQQIEALKQELSALKETLAKQTDNFTHATATGAETEQLTDC